jgi:hypothetical protein
MKLKKLALATLAAGTMLGCSIDINKGDDDGKDEIQTFEFEPMPDQNVPTSRDGELKPIVEGMSVVKITDECHPGKYETLDGCEVITQINAYTLDGVQPTCGPSMDVSIKLGSIKAGFEINGACEKDAEWDAPVPKCIDKNRKPLSWEMGVDYIEKREVGPNGETMSINHGNVALVYPTCPEPEL